MRFESVLACDVARTGVSGYHPPGGHGAAMVSGQLEENQMISQAGVGLWAYIV